MNEHRLVPGQLVTINGTGLIQTSAVKFGTVKAATVTVVSDSQVTAVVPTLPLGAVTALADEGKLESDPDCVAQVCMLKNHATQTMQFCADQAVQILGGMGFMRGTRCERIYREVKVMMIGGGAEEIMKDLAARQLGL